MQPWAESFYSSLAWKRCRELVKKRDAYLCVDCMKKNKLTAAEEVHHIVELTPDNVTDPSIALDPSNLVSLCRECHRARHGARQHRYEIDERGNVKIIE